jgi:hypothetical protein
MIETFKNFLTTEVLMVLVPVLFAEFCLIAFCIYKIFKEGVANLNKWAWLAIVVFGNLIGSIAFLLAGRRRDL